MVSADAVFECSFEVCNKVGGIYTVLCSKAARMVEEYGDGYCTVGIWNGSNAKIEFEEKNTPKKFVKAFDRLADEGINCHFGTWLIEGRPNTILVDATTAKISLDGLKSSLWEDYQIDSIKSDSWFNDPLIWSSCCGKLIEEYSKDNPKEDIVGHFHEWLSGFALLHLKKVGAKVATVFTTHATILGRSISASGTDLYRMVDEGIKRGEAATIDIARRYGCEDKYSTEVACAKVSDVFSTVSEITGREATYILGKKPDILLYNGLDINKYPQLEELSVMRKNNRQQMKGFLQSYFCRYYDMDFSKITSLFLSGRYEFHNKGIDVLCDALGKLNKLMKAEKSEKQLLAFFFVPSGTRGEDMQVLKNKSLYEEIVDHVNTMLPHIGSKIIDNMVAGRTQGMDIFTRDQLQDIKKLSTYFTEKRGRKPPLTAYELSYPQSQDSIIQALERNGLTNDKNDMVKIVIYPAYLDSVDRLISMDYDDATLTCDVGVFPSFYEPWGYTPLEMAAQGTLSITSDLAGFGLFMKGKGDGIQVLDMDGVEYNKIVDQLVGKLDEIIKLKRDDLTRRRLNAKDLATQCDWKNFVKNYTKAHQMALNKI